MDVFDTDSHTINGGIQAILVLCYIGNACGLIANTLLAISILRVRNFHSVDNFMNLNIIFADIFICLNALWFDALSLGQSETHMTFVICQISGALGKTMHS